MGFEGIVVPTPFLDRENGWLHRRLCRLCGRGTAGRAARSRAPMPHVETSDVAPYHEFVWPTGPSASGSAHVVHVDPRVAAATDLPAPPEQEPLRRSRKRRRRAADFDGLPQRPQQQAAASAAATPADFSYQAKSDAEHNDAPPNIPPPRPPKPVVTFTGFEAGTSMRHAYLSELSSRGAVLEPASADGSYFAGRHIEPFVLWIDDHPSNNEIERKWMVESLGVTVHVIANCLVLDDMIQKDNEFLRIAARQEKVICITDMHEMLPDESVPAASPAERRFHSMPSAGATSILQLRNIIELNYSKMYVYTGKDSVSFLHLREVLGVGWDEDHHDLGGVGHLQDPMLRWVEAAVQRARSANNPPVQDTQSDPARAPKSPYAMYVQTEQPTVVNPGRQGHGGLRRYHGRLQDQVDDDVESQNLGSSTSTARTASTISADPSSPRVPNPWHQNRPMSYEHPLRQLPPAHPSRRQEGSGIFGADFPVSPLRGHGDAAEQAQTTVVTHSGPAICRSSSQHGQFASQGHRALQLLQPGHEFQQHYTHAHQTGRPSLSDFSATATRGHLGRMVLQNDGNDTERDDPEFPTPSY